MGTAELGATEVVVFVAYATVTFTYLWRILR